MVTVGGCMAGACISGLGVGQSKVEEGGSTEY